jgi:hypothetical protein
VRRLVVVVVRLSVLEGDVDKTETTAERMALPLA